MSSFDKFACSYSAEIESVISFAGQKHDFFMRAKVDAILDVLRAQLGDPSSLHLLDVGCGVGLTDSMLEPLVGKVTGVDVSEKAIAEARRRNPSLEFAVYSGPELPFEEGAVDVAFAICVLHHVPPEGWPSFVSELRRVVRRGGLVMLLEHNPYNPLTRLVVAKCSFDDDALLLSRARATRLLRDVGMKIVDRRDILFVPWQGRVWRNLEAKLGTVPLGAQYVAAGRVP